MGAGRVEKDFPSVRLIELTSTRGSVRMATDTNATVDDGRDAVDGAVEDVLSQTDVKAEEDNGQSDDDAFLMYLTNEYQKWRIWTLVLAILGFSVVLLAIGLSQAHIIELKIFNLMMSIANLFIVMMLVIAFTRTRPFKKKIRSYDQYYVSVVDHDAPDGVRIEQRQLPDMDDFFKIFERQARTELIPETEEYRGLRKTWITIYVVAAVLAVAAIALYLAVPTMSLAATLMLLVAIVLVVVAFYFDRTRMRPLRTKWARDNYGMSEFQVRDRMREEKN